MNTRVFSKIAYNNEVLANLPQEYYDNLEMLPDSLRITAQHRYGLYATEIKRRHHGLTFCAFEARIKKYWEHYVLALIAEAEYLARSVKQAYHSLTKNLEVELVHTVLCDDEDYVANITEAIEADLHAGSDAVDYVKMELYSKGWSPSSTVTNSIEYYTNNPEETELQKHVKMSILLKCSFKRALEIS